MIRLSSEKQLSILLPNSNRALAEVLKNATPDELKTIVQAKDVRAVVTGLLHETLQNTKADTIVLDLLKNSPVFKNMGSMTNDLRQLIETLPKSEGKMGELQKALKGFLKNVEVIEPALLKKQVGDSGVFLESKLARTIEPKAELRNLLGRLTEILKSSDEVPAKEIIRQVRSILQSEQLLSTAPEIDLKPLSRKVADVVKQLQNLLVQSDPVRSKEVAKLTERLMTVLKAADLPATPGTQTSVRHTALPQELPTPKQLHSVVAELKHELLHSRLPQSRAVIALLETIETKAALIKEMPLLQRQRPQVAQPLQALATQLQALREEKVFPFPKPMTQVLEQLQGMLQGSTLRSEPLFFTAVEKLLNTLLQILPVEQHHELNSVARQIESILAGRPRIVAELFAEQKLPAEVQGVVEKLDMMKHHGDVVFGREMARVIEKLLPFGRAESLMPEAIMKESLSHDVKALLLQLGDELQKSPLPNTADIMKQLDRVMLQIDYYQLFSHLSSTSALYLPFTWDALQQGSLSFKRGKAEQFFCEINLQLKEYGELNLMLMLYEKNQLNIRAFTETASLKKRLIEAMPQLRSALNSVDIMPRQIRVFQKDETEAGRGYTSGSDEVDLGFEVKV